MKNWTNWKIWNVWEIFGVFVILVAILNILIKLQLNPLIAVLMLVLVNLWAIIGLTVYTWRNLPKTRPKMRVPFICFKVGIPLGVVGIINMQVLEMPKWYIWTILTAIFALFILGTILTLVRKKTT